MLGVSLISEPLITCRSLTPHLLDKFSTRPYFGDAETDVTVQQGEAAFFNCHVFSLANQTVSPARANLWCEALSESCKAENDANMTLEFSDEMI